ncbi:AIPR family protein, partial [Dehalococcoidia bacterium]|nr:AIPR family protein [Dehalococcoidia bacterium]
MFLLTNKKLNMRVDRIDEREIRSKKAHASVWDLTRMWQSASSTKTREEMEIDFANDFGGSVPALPAHVPNTSYKAYMAVISGSQLADIYERWGDRLLENNVRVFLQTAGKVNRGIRNTISNEPDMFFAYNNGITATADDISFDDSGGQLSINRVRNLQIVNGGQTTGSIFNAKLAKRDISKVFIQMKLSVIDPEESEKIVPSISMYANSQNAVNLADLSANHAFHVAIEEFSRRIFTPQASGSTRRSKWFYERARGQHRQDRAILQSAADKKKFELDYPTRKPELIKYPQKFTKTDLAKFANVWESQPHVVSRGATKNYAVYFKEIDEKWEKDRNQFNEMFYENLIAKAIIFRATEKLVSDADWYEPGGARAQIVYYSIAKLADDVKKMGKHIDFDEVWKTQEITPGLKESLEISAYETTHQVLNKTGKVGQLVSEWAKNQQCWSRVSNLEIAWPDSLEECLIGRAEQKENQRAAKKDQKVLNGVEAQKAVMSAKPKFWGSMRAFGMEKSLLSPNDLTILNIASAIHTTGRMPEAFQCDSLLQAYSRLQEEGFQDDIAS